MSSRKSAASRANGAKSHGPVTPEGKAASSRNSSTHGIFRSSFTLRNENDSAFLAMEAEFKEEWNPQGPTETALVEQMIISQWRLKRIWEAEVAGIDMQMDCDAPELQSKYHEFDEPCRTASALKNLADNSKFLDLMQRYDRGLSRQFDRALARLRELQRDRTTQPPQPDTNNLPNDSESPEPEEVELQNEPERLPELRAVLPIDDARRLLASLGYPLPDPVDR